MHYAYTCRQTPSHFQTRFYLSPCAHLFYSSRPLFTPLPPSISVCLSHSFFCNQAEHCLGYFHTFPTSVCVYCFLSPPSLPSFSHLSYKAVISAVQCALPPRSPSLSLLSCLFFLSPPLLLHCLSVLLFPSFHSATKQLNALYILISLPRTPSLAALFLPLPQCLPQHLFVLKKWQSSTSLVNSYVLKLSVYLFSQPRCVCAHTHTHTFVFTNTHAAE